MAEGKKGKRTLWSGLLLPTPERKKFGKTDDSRLLNQNILFQSHVFKTWEYNSPVPSIFCLLNLSCHLIEIAQSSVQCTLKVVDKPLDYSADESQLGLCHGVTKTPTDRFQHKQNY